MKKISFKQIFTIAFYLLFFLLLLKNSLRYLDPDLGWHLRAGEEVVKTGQVNRINYYNYSVGENSTWVNHEWLSDALLFLIYNNSSYFFLSILFALIFCLTLIITQYFIIKNWTIDKKSIIVILPTFLLGLIACYPSIGVRVQQLSLLFLLLELIIIYNFEKESLKNDQQSWKKLIPLPILIVLWANMHGSFLLGICLPYFYLIIKIIESFIFIFRKKYSLINKIGSFFNFKTKLKKKDLKIFFGFTIISSFCALLTPYGLKLFNFLSSYKNNAYLKLIAEWLPQYYEPFFYFQIIYIGIIIAALFTSFLLYKNKKENNSLWQFSLVLFFIFMAIKSKRHFPLLFISSLPFLSTFLYEEIKDVVANIKIKKSIIDIFIKVYFNLLFLSIFALLLTKIKIVKNPFIYYCRNYPCQAVEFLKNKPGIKEARLFNTYGWGGYLTHQWPEKKIFIDGRLPQVKVNNHSYLEEYLLFFKDEQTIKEKIEEYQLELFLLKKPESAEKSHRKNWFEKIINKAREEKSEEKEENRLINFLEKNFKKIYEDDITLIYFKKDGL